MVNLCTSIFKQLFQIFPQIATNLLLMKQMKTTRILYLAGKFTAKPSQRPLQSHDAPPQQGAVTKPNEEQKKTAELDFAPGL